MMGNQTLAEKIKEVIAKYSWGVSNAMLAARNGKGGA